MAPVGAAAALDQPRSAWVLAEPIEGHSIGETLVLDDADVVRGDWGLLSLGVVRDRRIVLGHKLHDVDRMLSTFCEERIRACRAAVAVAGGDLAVGEDVRTPSVQCGPDGTRNRSYWDSVNEMMAVEFDDFPLEGPRTAEWWISEVAKVAEGPSAQQRAWVREARICFFP